MRFASLGSGSQGNTLIVDAGDTRLLLDCGFSARATVERLGRLSIAAEDIDGILLTHEHSDHIAGAFKFASRFAIPVYLTHGTHLAAPRGKSPLLRHARWAVRPFALARNANALPSTLRAMIPAPLHPASA